ncbi:MAG: hypothetical protein ACRC0F_00830 [Cetobacterium sp.]
MGKSVKITSGDITIDVQLNLVEYKFDYLDDNGFDKNNKYLIKVKLSGDIVETTKKETLKFLEWSLDNQNNVYRDVEIQIGGTNNEERRIYKLEGAFIADYMECFAGDDGKGIFTVNLIQRKEKTNKENVKFYAE